MNQFKELNNKLENNKICYIIGEIGIGKKKFVNDYNKFYNLKSINLNFIRNTRHIYVKKKTFLQELPKICQKNIHSFFNTQNEIIVIHNIEDVNDKIYHDKLMNLKKIITKPIIIIVNSRNTSERFINYITQKNPCIFLKSKTIPEIEMIYKKKCSDLDIDYPAEFSNVISKNNGNLTKINTRFSEFLISSCDIEKTDIKSHILKNDKFVVKNSFKILCDESISWDKKMTLIRSQGALFKTLMIRHISSGLDEKSNLSFKEKLDVAIEIFDKMTLSGDSFFYSNKFVSLTKILYPTLKIKNPTINNIILSKSYNSSENVKKSHIDLYADYKKNPSKKSIFYELQKYLRS